MTKQELEQQLKAFGSKGKEIAAEIYDKLEEEKAELDTDTRRTVRSFWVFVSAIAFAAGIGIGYVFL